MTLSADFGRYLLHFGETVPVSTLHLDPDGSGLCALRHDVDHDLDVALEMGHREHEMGMRATYFILPTAPYWNDPQLIEKCLQLQDYGHEVGLHVNCMAEWAGGKTDNPEAMLRTQLARLRDGGVEILGISAHGDRRCYENQVSNYWCFRELRPDDPFQTENGRTAEGPYEADGRTRLVYPESDEVIRADGERQALWSISMASLGLQYHAWHTLYDRYFSDSGGGWTRTPDPLAFQRGSERWQVLIHPIHWLGPKRRFFLLSTARSGSKWLSEVLEQATPVKARHEYILNQDFYRGEAASKATSNYRALEDNPDEVQTRLSDAWEELDKLKVDYAEVNVYLEPFSEMVRRFFPEAIFVHLHRHPAKVVRSLMDRDWYDTPEDQAHRRIVNSDEVAMSRFERVCQYVTEVNEHLLEYCDYQVSLEDLTQSPESLATILKSLGIVYHPRLGSNLVTTIVNATKTPEFPLIKQWSQEHKATFDSLAGDITLSLGYSWESSVDNGSKSVSEKGWRDRWPGLFKRHTRRIWSGQKEVIIETDADRFNAVYCDKLVNDVGVVIQTKASDNNPYLTLGGSNWHSTKGMTRSSGWPVRPMYYVRGSLKIQTEDKLRIAVFALNYDRKGKQMYRRQLGVLDRKQSCLEFAFAPHPEADVFDIALYMSKSQAVGSAAIEQCQLVYKAYSC